MPVSVLTRPVKTVSEMIPLCGPKLLQTNGSTPGLVLEFKPSYHQNMLSHELDILIPLGVFKIYNSSLLVGHVVLDMLVKACSQFLHQC